MTMAAWPAMRATLDYALGRHDAQLVLVSAVPRQNVRVTYDGWPIEARPSLQPPESSPGYVVFGAMRSFSSRPVIEVSWMGPAGPEAVSREMRQFKSHRLCLYVLQLDDGGRPVPPDRRAELSPFRYACDGWWSPFGE